MGTMLDTASDPVSTFKGLKFDSFAAYGNGSYENYNAARKAYPRLRCLEIDVWGQGIGNTGDFEPGDMALDHAGRWAAGRIAAGVWRPVIYFSIGSWDPIAASLKAAGVSRSDIRIWSAHYTGREHLCTSACQGTFTGTADATQWGSPKPKNTLPPAYASRNVDISKTSPNFWVRPPVAPDFERELKVGSKGHAVEIWQHQMKLRGWHVPLSGTFDPICEGICKTFQKEKGLRVTGRVDTKTWSATWIEPITS